MDHRRNLNSFYLNITCKFVEQYLGDDDGSLDKIDMAQWLLEYPAMPLAAGPMDKQPVAKVQYATHVSLFDGAADAVFTTVAHHPDSVCKWGA
jgi:hypothetical protein